MNLTEHFTLDELTSSETAERNGWDNTPSENELENLRRLASFLEEVKTALGGKPIMVSSGYRGKQVNDSVGSKDTSQHRVGCAVDFRVPGLTPDQVVKAIVASGLPYDQLIREFDRWTHLSIPSFPNLPPRKMALIIDKAGTRTFA